MATTSKYGFTMFTTIDEFKSWLNKQAKYNYTGIQVHHTAAPSYSNFYKSNGTTEDELTRQNSMKAYHVNTNGWSDIAQHFTIFPNGNIVTGRALSKTTAIGIKGWNSNKICIENYGNFDSDVMSTIQKNTIIAVYALLCKKFGITPSASTIRYHAWFTAGGTYLGDYNSSRSAKSCPGKQFFGGNTMEAFKANFLPAIKEYMNSGGIDTREEENTSNETTTVVTPNTGTKTSYTVKILVDDLNIRQGPSASYSVSGTVKKGGVYTIVEESNGWGKLKSGIGWISLSSSYVQKISTSYTVRILESSLNVRTGPATSYSVSGTVKKGEVYTVVEESNGWGKLKSGIGWISLSSSYVQKL